MREATLGFHVDEHGLHAQRLTLTSTHDMVSLWLGEADQEGHVSDGYDNFLVNRP